MKKLALIFVALLCIACSGSERTLLDIDIIQLQATGISSGVARELTSYSDGSAWFGEACVDEPHDDTLWFQAELAENTEYQLAFRHTTASCMNPSITLDAKLYLFDEEERLVTSAETDDAGSVIHDFVAKSSSIHYVAIVPKFEGDTGGFTLVLSKVDEGD